MKIFNIPKREEGQGLVEYALVLVLVAIVVIAILTMLGSSIVLVYAQVIGGFTGQTLSGTGTEGIVISGGGGVDLGNGTCQIQDTDISVVVVQDGAVITEGSQSVQFIFGTAISTQNVTFNSSGIGTATVPALINDCPANLKVNPVP